MNDSELKKFVGEKHVEEVKALIGKNGKLPQGLKLKNPKVTLILSIFLGMVGVDRLYQEGVKLFLCKIAMLALTLGVWWIPDIGYSIPVTREMNYNKIIAAM